MRWRGCRVSVKNLRHLYVTIVALTLGIMVGILFHVLPGSKDLHRYATPDGGFVKEETIQWNHYSAHTLDFIKSRIFEADNRKATSKSKIPGALSLHENFLHARFLETDSQSEVLQVSDDMENEIECSLPDQTFESKMIENSSEHFSILPANFMVHRKYPTPLPICGTGDLLDPWTITGDNSWMIFLVKTAPKNVRRRNFIRLTWGSIDILRGKRFRTLFLVGRVRSNEEQALLKEENDIFGDLLQCDFDDDYKTLPLKVLSSFGWLLQSRTQSRFYTVTDDDCVMNMMNIVTFFEFAPERIMICGFIYDKNCAANRKVGGKWYISQKTYDAKYYPAFCHGGMWTITGSMMRDLLCMAQITDQNGFYLEDVYITGILREKLQTNDTNIKPALKPSGDKYLLMFYPWIETEKAIKKMALRWKAWNSTLPWNSKLVIEGYPVLKTRPRKNIFDKTAAARLPGRWKSLETPSRSKTKI